MKITKEIIEYIEDLVQHSDNIWETKLFKDGLHEGYQMGLQKAGYYEPAPLPLGKDGESGWYFQCIRCDYWWDPDELKKIKLCQQFKCPQCGKIMTNPYFKLDKVTNK